MGWLVAEQSPSKVASVFLNEAAAREAAAAAIAVGPGRVAGRWRQMAPGPTPAASIRGQSKRSTHFLQGILTMQHHSQEMQQCIQDCLACHAVCYGMAMTHCLDSGGDHVAPAHLRLMLACAEICATSARMMLMDSPYHGNICRECAEICRACAADCERLDGMAACVDACRKCADSCDRMAAAPHH